METGQLICSANQLTSFYMMATLAFNELILARCCDGIDKISMSSYKITLSSASDKIKLFARNFSKNSNLDDSGISLPVSPSRTNLKLHNISITPKMVEKVITNLDSSKASGPDCIPVVVLKNCEPELSYILAKLFNKCLKESCFPDCWKVSSVVPVFKNVG